MRAALLALVVVAGCSDSSFSLKFRLTHGDAQQCTSDTGGVAATCDQVTMLCDAYLSVRILKPDDPSAPYVHLCVPLEGAQHTLCSIATPSYEVPSMPVEDQTLEVQMAVFPASAIHPDPDTGEDVCPQVEYGADGLPVAVLPMCTDPDPFSCPRVPAVGGRTYYHPGDSETVVDLGCTDLAQLTDPLVCEGTHYINVTTTVDDFDNVVASVDRAVADRLTVDIGEPSPLADTYVLNPGDTASLDPNTTTPPAWSATVDLDIATYACIVVLEDGAATTPSLRCYGAAGKSTLDVPGTFVKKSTLSAVLAAIGMPSFPDSGGLVLGVVVDSNFSPLAGQTINTSCAGCNVQYINADRTGTVSGATSSSGIFVSTDAPFGTTFSIASPDPSASTSIGGIVEGKVTVVVLQYNDLKPN